MSSTSEQNRPKTPFEMVKSTIDQEHPADLMVASRLPQVELKQRIRNATDKLLNALDERESLWVDLEDLLNERDSGRTEAYFNLGYEYGIAAGRAEAFGKLGENADIETRRLGERLRMLVKGTSLPTSAIVAALLETTWAFAHDIETTNA